MAATLTTTRQNDPGVGGRVRRYALTWVSHTDGAVDLTTDQAIVGQILRVVFTNGAATPTDAYDVLLKDAHGIDVLGGQGANIAIANPFHICPGVAMKDGTTTSTRPVSVAGPLELVITNAGSGKAGTIYLYVE